MFEADIIKINRHAYIVNKMNKCSHDTETDYEDELVDKTIIIDCPDRRDRLIVNRMLKLVINGIEDGPDKFEKDVKIPEELVYLVTNYKHLINTKIHFRGYGPDSENFTILFQTVIKGRINTLKYLVENGADLHATMTYYNMYDKLVNETLNETITARISKLEVTQSVFPERPKEVYENAYAIKEYIDSKRI